ncbi:MAG: GNAT family N-acetyltransferase [Acidobacteria bacterium]|nr:MAG: GNAT family N-acetyltransferase [Acidobacteriota bacterium]
MSGPLEQVHQVRRLLALDAAETTLQGDEGLYAVDLSDLVVPEALSTGAIACRAASSNERDTLCAWRLAYDIEALGATDTPDQRARASAFLDAQIAGGNAWVAVEDNLPVSLAAFNAALPDIVQLGGIYTPPELRGRGFAKVAVAGSLLVAQERGASRAVLFTNNRSAVRSYTALGFSLVGEYSVVLFKR